MKFIACIISFYILALAVIPCSDVHDIDNNGTGKAIVSSVNHASQQSAEEHCSPFCNCNCCGQTFHFTSIQTDLSITQNVIDTKNSCYEPIFVSEVFSSIWQPPKSC